MIEKHFTIMQTASGNLYMGEGIPDSPYADQYDMIESINKDYHVIIHFRIYGLSWLEYEMLLVIINDWVNEYGVFLEVGVSNRLIDFQPFKPANEKTKIATVIDPKHPYYGTQVKVEPYHRFENEFLGEYYWMPNRKYPAIDVFRAGQLGHMLSKAEADETA